MTETNFKHNQIQAIKKRLNTAFEQSGLKTFYRLTECIKSETDFKDVNYNTIQSALDYSKDALDITAVIAICRLFHLDTAYVLSPPNTAVPELSHTQLDTGNFIVLDDPKYFGTFHGFFYSPNHKSKELIKFELAIKNTDDKVTATMFYHGRPRSVQGIIKSDDRTLYGTPCLCTRHSNIYIQLTDDLGDFYYLYFNRQEFRSHDLYFRRGIALTGSSLRNHPVLQLNFVLFAQPIPDEKMVYIPGLLADVSRTFHVSKSVLETLRTKEPLVENFYQNFKHILEHDAETMYPINEEQLLLSNSSTMKKYDIIRALLLLKDQSSASKKVVHEDIEDFASFSKNVLQQPGNTELSE